MASSLLRRPWLSPAMVSLNDISGWAVSIGVSVLLEPASFSGNI